MQMINKLNFDEFKNRFIEYNDNYDENVSIANQYIDDMREYLQYDEIEDIVDEYIEKVMSIRDELEETTQSKTDEEITLIFNALNEIIDKVNVWIGELNEK